MYEDSTIVLWNDGAPLKAYLWDVFSWDDGVYRLGRLVIKATGDVEHRGCPVSLSDIETWFDQELMGTIPTAGLIVRVARAGVFTASESWESIKHGREFVKEIENVVRELNGQTTTVELCREAYLRFAAEPTAENRHALREAYERMPAQCITDVRATEHPQQLVDAIERAYDEDNLSRPQIL